MLSSAAVPAFAAPGDQQFVNQAAMGGMAEVRMAQLALSKTSSGRVRMFANRMIHDHTANNALLARVARRGGYSLPMGVGPMNAAVARRLSMLSGREFDRAYLRAQVDAHQRMLALMQNEASGGGDPRLRRFAADTAPTVQQHLSMAQADLGHGMM